MAKPWLTRRHTPHMQAVVVAFVKNAHLVDIIEPVGRVTDESCVGLKGAGT